MITFRDRKQLKDYDSVSLAAQLRQFFVYHYPADIVQRLDDAIQVASYLHRHDVRRGSRSKLPNPPYIEHPLRVALRLFVYFGVRDYRVILAAILHDTVEDHPFEFADFHGVLPSQSEQEARGHALQFISSYFGYEVAKLVEQVSNPILLEGISKAEKVASYQEHVVATVNSSVGALLIKVSDFCDNGGSLHHHYEYGDPKVTYFLDRYEPLIPVYREALAKIQDPDFAKGNVEGRLLLVETQFKLFRDAA